ncbi:MAG: hypothetical protein JWM11_4650 [Planctomycetaceae bacterium]|nr:hypothetical protein [Planctomycetaceae bacterium]
MADRVVGRMVDRVAARMVPLTAAAGLAFEAVQAREPQDTVRRHRQRM